MCIRDRAYTMQGTSSGIYFAPETTEFIDCILTLVNSESFNNFNAAKRDVYKRQHLSR